MLQRKGTIEPDSKFLGGEDFNPKRFITRKGIGSTTNIDQVLKSEQKDEKVSHLNWLYEMISWIELVIKEPNLKSVINKYWNIFKDLLEVEKIYFLKINKNNTKFETIVKGEKREVLVTERLLFKIFKETKMLILHDTSDERLFDPRFNKFFETKISNLLSIPVIQSNGTIMGIVMILNRQKPFKMTEKGILMFSKKHELLAHLLSYLLSNLLLLDEVKTQRDKESERIATLISTTEEMLKLPSSAALIKSIQDFVPKYMDCNRVTFYLLDSQRNELYQSYVDKDGKNKLKSYSAQKGICGYVASTSISIILNEVYDDSRYNPEIDDPDNDGNIKSMLTAPVQCQNTNSKLSFVLFILITPIDSHLLTVRGVIQLINKNDNTQFDHRDQKRLDVLCSILGRFQDVVFKLEDFYSLRSISENLKVIDMNLGKL